MDNQRLFAWAAFGLLAFMTYQTWMLENREQATPAETTQGATEAQPSSDAPGLPELPADSGGDGELPVVAPADSDPTAAPALPTDEADKTIRVSTDVLDLEINTRGGVLQAATLKEYPVAKDQPDTLVQLLSPDFDFATMQAGLIGGNNEPYFNAQLTSESDSFDLGDAEQMTVVLSWTNENGISIDKRLVFTRGSYRVDVEHVVTNNSSESWRAADYTLLNRKGGEQERSMFDVDTYSFDGPIIYDGEKSEKTDYDDLVNAPLEIRATNGWVGGIEHHFLRAIVPPEGTTNTLKITAKDGRTTSSVFGEAVNIAPGAQHTFTTTLFIGPKLQDQLEEIAPSLKLTVDYGFLTILSNPLFWLLSWVYGFVGNWGVAIIVVTILIKLAFYKLTEKSGRSMAKMREIQPRMKAIQERYKDDRQAQSQAMMELYKREKVNPAAGCLPILIQMPFFLAFYWVLLESVEMRQAPFALWITDLSSRDPYFILPIIMGAAMLFQQKLNPAPADPVQARVMQIMPIMFTGFFAFFPSGLVLYWVTNTVLSIAQQWWVNKVVEEEGRAAKKNKSQKKAKKNDS